MDENKASHAFTHRDGAHKDHVEDSQDPSPSLASHNFTHREEVPLNATPRLPYFGAPTFTTSSHGAIRNYGGLRSNFQSYLPTQLCARPPPSHCPIHPQPSPFQPPYEGFAGTGGFTPNSPCPTMQAVPSYHASSSQTPFSQPNTRMPPRQQRPTGHEPYASMYSGDRRSNEQFPLSFAPGRFVILDSSYGGRLATAPFIVSDSDGINGSLPLDDNSSNEEDEGENQNPPNVSQPTDRPTTDNPGNHRGKRQRGMSENATAMVYALDRFTQNMSKVEHCHAKQSQRNLEFMQKKTKADNDAMNDRYDQLCDVLGTIADAFVKIADKY